MIFLSFLICCVPLPIEPPLEPIIQGTYSAGFTDYQVATFGDTLVITSDSYSSVFWSGIGRRERNNTFVVAWIMVPKLGVPDLSSHKVVSYSVLEYKHGEFRGVGTYLSPTTKFDECYKLKKEK